MTGQEGPPGELGEDGPPGPKGEKGMSGEIGDTGEKGYRVSITRNFTNFVSTKLMLFCFFIEDLVIY